MWITTHLILTGLIQGAAFVAGALAAFYALPPDLRAWLDFLAIVPIGGTALLSAMGTRWLTRLLPARCPKCGGQAFQLGSRPIYYECRECGHIVTTRFRTDV